MRPQSLAEMLTFDCVILVDGSLTSSAVRRLFALLDAHREVGLGDEGVSTAIIPLRRHWQRTSWLRSRPAQRRLEEGRFVWLDPERPVQTRLALVLSPSLATFHQTTPLRLLADRVLIWPIEAAIGPVDDKSPGLAEVGERIQRILNAPVTWAARSETERRALATALPSLPLAAQIWWPVVADIETGHQDADGGVRRPGRTIGRHWHERTLSQAASDEWQESCYEPWGSDLTLELRGRRSLLDALPASSAEQMVSSEDDGRRPLETFLAELDLFVALGENQDPLRIDEEIIEALAARVPVIAPPRTAARFDRRLPSAEARFLGNLAERLLVDDDAREAARRDQTSLFEARHGVAAYRRRLAPLVEGPERSTPVLWSGQTRRPGRVLFISDDSSHFEHLRRQLAVAQKLKAPLKPYFLTMARDAALVEQMRFPVEFVLAHKSQTYRAIFGEIDERHRGLTKTGIDPIDRTDVWNRHLARHLHELIAFADVKAIVFDGMYPFSGLAEACARRPMLPFAWIRRGLWQAGANATALERQSVFDLVIEPGDLAGNFDRGPTAAKRDQVLPTGPILMPKTVPAARARYELGIDTAQVAVFLQPTLAGPHRKSEALQALIQALADGGCTFWTSELIPGTSPPSWPIDTETLGSLAADRQLSAFDIIIGGADYRSLHDAQTVRKPTVVMPDTSRETDDQMTRAMAASRAGWAIMLTRGDVYAARAAARQLLDPATRAMMTGLCKPDEREEGAETAALAISQMIYSLDLKAPLAWRKATA